MSFRVQPQNLEFPDPRKFGTTFTYFTDHPSSAVESDNYFNGTQTYVEPGDEIKVSCLQDDGSWVKSTFEVSAVTPGQVVVEQITEWRCGGRQVIRGLKAVHKGRGKWDVVDSSNQKINSIPLTKDEAQSFIDGQISVTKEPVAA